jgi:hypothetical protein
LEASATERQLVLSWHSLRCANHPFYACAFDSWQLSFKMVNRYVRKGAAAKAATKRTCNERQLDNAETYSLYHHETFAFAFKPDELTN